MFENNGGRPPSARGGNPFLTPGTDFSKQREAQNQARAQEHRYETTQQPSNSAGPSSYATQLSEKDTSRAEQEGQSTPTETAPSQEPEPELPKEEEKEGSKNKQTGAGEESRPPMWQADEQATHCNSCNERFDTFRRRHHCRGCGLVFCSSCTQTRMLVPESWRMRDPQRMCGACAAQLAPQQEVFAASHSNSTRINDKLNTESSRRYFNRPLNFTLGGEIRKAVYSLENLMRGIETVVDDVSLQTGYMRDTKGILFITTAKIAFIGGVLFGTGLLITKLPSRDGKLNWSAPCAVGAYGLSIGAEAGVETVDMIVPITDDKTLREFAYGERHLSLAGEAGFSLGPLGRSYTRDRQSNTAYSHAKGFYGGVALRGAIVTVRADVNQNYYGKELSGTKILTGKIDPPNNAMPLYKKLDEYFAWAFQFEQRPSEVFRPKVNGGQEGTPTQNAPPPSNEPDEDDLVSV